MDKIVEILEQVVLPKYRDHFDKTEAMQIAAEIRASQWIRPTE